MTLRLHAPVSVSGRTTRASRRGGRHTIHLVATVLRRAAQGLVKSVASTYDRARPPSGGVVVLAYHRVGGGTTLDVDLDPVMFDEQMAYLASEADVVDLHAGLESLDDVGSPSKVVVTFDDGTIDFVEHALPSLVKHDIPATYYVASQFIEDERPFPNNGTPLSWAALREATATGLVTVGSHTHSHAVMDKIGPDEADEELRRSTELIENEVGRPVDHFAYPKGVFGGVANEAVIARYCRSAALANCGVNPYRSTNRLRLRRSPIQRSDGMTYFRRKVAGGMTLEGSLRSALNRSRYAARRS